MSSSLGFAATCWAKKAVKLALLAPAALRKDSEPGLLVLIYHRVGARMNQEMDLPAARFASQMKFLSEHMRVVELAQAVARFAAGEKPDRDEVAVTFDDGYAEVFTRAWPVLAEFAVPATLFLSTGFMEGESAAPLSAASASGSGAAGPRALTWEQVADLRASGLISVGSHSHSHRDFDTLSPEEAAIECARSKEIIERRTGVPAELFAYPRGVVAHAGVTGEHYGFAFGTGGGKIHAGEHFGPAALARTPVRASDGDFFFRRALSGADPLEDRLYAKLKGGGR